VADSLLDGARIDYFTDRRDGTRGY
jgi:hypothetical protein